MKARCAPLPKGKRANIPAPSRGDSGNANKTGNVCRGSGKSCLFFLTPQANLETIHSAIGHGGWKSTALVAVSGAPLLALENPVAHMSFSLGRTHNRIRSPR